MYSSNQYPSTKPEYYNPLSSGSFKNGFSGGPSSCVFSSPKVSYSKETQELIKILMEETKLTATQKQGFQGLLRSGDPPPVTSKSSAFARRNEYLQRRTQRGLSLGLEMPGSTKKLSVQGVGGRRSLDSIKKATAEEPPSNMPRTYVPVNKEVEKVRFSYKMEFGKEPSQDIMDHLMGNRKAGHFEASQQISPTKTFEEEKEERFNELMVEIRDRIEFLGSMKDAKQDKAYHAMIIFQIRKKLEEIKVLFPEKVAPVIQNLGLRNVDPLFVNFCKKN